MLDASLCANDGITLVKFKCWTASGSETGVAASEEFKKGTRGT